MGPFTFRGYILNPVSGWTTHHSIVEFKNKWHLFYHDCSISPYRDRIHLRCMKMAELEYDKEGMIKTIDPYGF